MEEPYTPSTVEEVFKDYKARRSAMVKALTTDVEDFFQECDPAKENLCLYGLPDEDWKVGLPAEEVPPELPEPALGINFARDGMSRRDWLSLVAVHSDAWLYAVAMYHCARFDKNERMRLFDLINGQPTVYEVVSGRARSVKEKNSKSKKKDTGSNHKKRAPAKKEEDDYEDEDDDEHGDTFCGSCAGAYSDSQFWIACDACQKWYHGLCVKMTAAKAANIEEYNCPSCTHNKKARV